MIIKGNICSSISHGIVNTLTTVRDAVNISYAIVRPIAIQSITDAAEAYKATKQNIYSAKNNIYSTLEDPIQGVVAVCDAYTNTCDKGIAITRGAVSCVQAVGGAAAFTIQNGIGASVRALAESLYGIKSFKQSVAALTGKTDDKNKKQFSERLGEATAHVFNGVGRMTVMGATSFAYLYGSASNVLCVQANPLSFQETAQIFAYSTNKVASYLPLIAWNTTKAAAVVMKHVGGRVLSDPVFWGTSTLMAGTIYLTASQLSKAIKEPGIGAKLFHTAGAAIGIAATVVIAS